MGVVRILLNSPGVRVDSATAVQVSAVVPISIIKNLGSVISCDFVTLELRHVKFGSTYKQHIKFRSLQKVSRQNKSLEDFAWSLRVYILLRLVSNATE